MNSFDWHLITIDDPKFLPCKSLFDIFQILLGVIKFKFVIPRRIYGAGISSLLQYEDTVMETDKILKIITDITQFDWGDFFFFLEYPKNWFCPDEQLYTALYPNVIAQTNTTVRAIDDQFIYIYTPYKAVVELIKTKYKIENVKKDVLENIEYPT